MKKDIPIFVISGKNPTYAPGGYAAYSHNLCRALKKLGYEVHIVCLGSKNSIEETDIGKLHVVRNWIANRIPFINSVQMASLLFCSYSFSREIEKIIHDNRYKKVMVWGMGPWGLAGHLLKNKYKKSIILTSSYFTTFRHEMRGSLNAIMIKDYGLFTKFKYLLVYNLLGPIFAFAEQNLISSSDFIITHYKSTERILKKEFAVNAKKFKRISYSAEIFKRLSRKNSSNKKTVSKLNRHPLVISVSRQDPRKGINFLINSIKILRNRKIKIYCLIVGNGNMLEANKKLANRLGVSENVKFMGFLDDFSGLFKKADAFISPAIEEGSGSLSILEAMSQGLTIIATKCDGIPEDIKNGETGILVNPMDAEDLANGIQRIIQHRKLAKQLGQNAKKTYENKFSFSKMENDIRKTLIQYKQT